MTRVGFALLALLPLLSWHPAPVWAEPRSPVPLAPAPEVAPASLPAREATPSPAEPAPAPARGESLGVAAPAPVLSPSGPSVTASALRLIGAMAAVGLVLAVGRMAARRFLVASSRARRRVPSGSFLRGGVPGLGRWFPSTGTVEEDLAVVARSWLGARGSVCIVRSGQERFLVGVSQAGISLLARLGSLPAGAARPAAPVGAAPPEALTADDFAAELADIAVAPPDPPELLTGEPGRGARRDVAELLARSRERLLRLTLSSSSPHARRRRA